MAKQKTKQSNKPKELSVTDWFFIKVIGGFFIGLIGAQFIAAVSSEIVNKIQMFPIHQILGWFAALDTVSGLAGFVTAVMGLTWFASEQLGIHVF